MTCNSNTQIQVLYERNFTKRMSSFLNGKWNSYTDCNAALSRGLCTEPRWLALTYCKWNKNVMTLPLLCWYKRKLNKSQATSSGAMIFNCRLCESDGESKSVVPLFWWRPCAGNFKSVSKAGYEERIVRIWAQRITTSSALTPCKNSRFARLQQLLLLLFNQWAKKIVKKNSWHLCIYFN